MQQLEEFLSAGGEGEIQALAGYAGQNVKERWRSVLDENREELLRRYDEVGEPAYGIYASILFRPVREQLKSAGFISEPRFPGVLALSEGWGPDEERERWMWSVVRRGREAPLGTIVVGLFHDHTRFRIPRPPEVLASDTTDTGTILEEISLGAR